MLLVLPALLVLLDWAAPCHARHGEHTVRIRTEGHRHTHPGNTHHYVRLQAIALERKYAPRTPTRDPARKSHRKRQVTAALSDDYQQGLDIEYTLPLGLGSSPAQQLVFDIDSGSSDTIVSAIACTGCSKAARFDPTRSNTYQELAETFTIAYGSGNVAGTVVRDSMRIGNASLTGQQFGLITSATGFSDVPSSGLLGLAFSNIALNQAPTVIDTLWTQGQLKTKMYSVHLTRYPEDASTLTLGGPNNEQSSGGNLTYFPVTEQALWTIGTTAILVNGVAVAAQPFMSAIDTGTTLMVLPRTLTAAFYKQIPGARTHHDAAYPATTDLYAFPCKSIATLSVGFAFKGSVQQYPIDGRDFNAGTLGGGYCLGAVMGMDLTSPLGTPIAVIGCSFLKSWQTVFNYEYDAGGSLIPAVGLVASEGMAVACPTAYVRDVPSNTCVKLPPAKPATAPAPLVVKAAPPKSRVRRPKPAPVVKVKSGKSKGKRAPVAQEGEASKSLAT